MDSKNTFLTTPKAVIIGSIVISVAILIAGGIIKIGPKNAGTAANTPVPTASPAARPQQPTVTLDAVKKAFSESQIKFGDTNKKLIILEISDPSCPYCSIATGKNPELNKEAGSRFTLVADGGTYVAPVSEIEKLVKNGSASFAWIYTPGHGNGEMGTKALYCAFEQGKFWEAHDLLMSSKGYDLLNNTVKNDKSKSADVANLLSSAVNSATLKSCLDSGKYDGRLQTDVGLAQGLGITGTPAFFLNATPFTGAYSYKDMESAVKTALGQ
ncbi:MAG: thioredoxin domain-containing protein [Candidatus Daviesbacteria bacterium]|nr:thioredoxin domain-containing protein [Candidatus Daviesbacteria bacterium]